MVHQFFLDRRPHNGLTYEEYKQNTINNLENTNPETLDDAAKGMYDYKKLNVHRSKRIEKVYKVNEDLSNIVKNIQASQLWMVITEDWCGDSAQNLPYIIKIAQENPLINLRIIERDKNTDIIDLYLSNGKSRSIPKLVVFDSKGNELFQWGPRPREAQQMVNFWKNSGLPKNEFMEKLHLWYAGNRGRNLEQEMMWLLCSVEECKEAS